MALKWGIAGAGKISTQFAKAVSILPQEEHQLVAVAAQNLERAEGFAQNLNIGKAYGDYKSLAEDDQVEIVYIGNLNTQHKEVTKLMLAHGKHVLCEKPLTLNEKHSREVIEFAREKQLFLMEAVWSRCFPAYEELQKLIKSGIIGDVLQIRTSFGKRFPHIERLASKELGGGTILDLGIYALQFVQLIYEGAEPTFVTATGQLNEQGVDECACALLAYSGGRMASISTDSRVQLTNEAVICGTKGIITVPRFWCPTTIITPTDTINFDLPQTTVEFKNSYTVGLCYEIQEVRKCIKTGLLESPMVTHENTIQLARLMDKVRKGVGVEFVEDNM